MTKTILNKTCILEVPTIVVPVYLFSLLPHLFVHFHLSRQDIVFYSLITRIFLL